MNMFSLHYSLVFMPISLIGEFVIYRVFESKKKNQNKPTLALQ